MRIGLFAGYSHYPRRALGDWRGFFNSISDAIEVGEAKFPETDSFVHDWWAVVDTDTMTVIEEGNNY